MTAKPQNKFLLSITNLSDLTAWFRISTKKNTLSIICYQSSQRQVQAKILEQDQMRAHLESQRMGQRISKVLFTNTTQILAQQKLKNMIADQILVMTRDLYPKEAIFLVYLLQI